MFGDRCKHAPRIVRIAGGTAVIGKGVQQNVGTAKLLEPGKVAVNLIQRTFAGDAGVLRQVTVGNTQQDTRADSGCSFAFCLCDGMQFGKGSIPETGDCRPERVPGIAVAHGASDCGVAAAAKVAAKKAADALNALKAAAAQQRKDDLEAAAQKLKDAAAVAEKSAKAAAAKAAANHEKSTKAAAAKAKALAKQAADRVTAAERKVKDLEIVKKAKAAAERTAKSAERGAKNVERNAKAAAKNVANIFRGF